MFNVLCIIIYSDIDIVIVSLNSCDGAKNDFRNVSVKTGSNLTFTCSLNGTATVWSSPQFSASSVVFVSGAFESQSTRLSGAVIADFIGYNSTTNCITTQVTIPNIQCSLSNLNIMCGISQSIQNGGIIVKIASKISNVMYLLVYKFCLATPIQLSLNSTKTCSNVTLNWKYDNGGCPITGYYVMNGSGWQYQTSNNEFEFTNIPWGTEYHYSVIAENVVGNSRVGNTSGIITCDRKLVVISMML